MCNIFGRTTSLNVDFAITGSQGEGSTLRIAKGCVGKADVCADVAVAICCSSLLSYMYGDGDDCAIVEGVHFEGHVPNDEVELVLFGIEGGGVERPIRLLEGDRVGNAVTVAVSGIEGENFFFKVQAEAGGGDGVAMTSQFYGYLYAVTKGNTLPNRKHGRHAGSPSQLRAATTVLTRGDLNRTHHVSDVNLFVGVGITPLGATREVALVYIQPRGAIIVVEYL